MRKRKPAKNTMQYAIDLGARSDLERARNAAMLHALFFWQLGERAVSVSVRAAWSGLGDDEMGAALRLDRELNGVRPGVRYPAARRRRASGKT
jgi:hypothetical protein